MMEFTTRELAFALRAPLNLIGGQVPEAVISGISIDSRTLRIGDVFFALKGTHADGSAFVEQALAAGAVCAVVAMKTADGKWEGLPVIPVSDPLKALGNAARAYRMKFAGKVVAVTGTTGKTTVKEMLMAVFGRRYRVHGTPGNYNNMIGLPLTIFGLGDDHECAVLELGMSAPGEIAYLADVARPDMGIILNAGPGHVEFFDSVEQVADAKAELFDALGPDHTAIINGDDQLLAARQTRCRSRLLTFGLYRPCTVRGEDLKLRDDGCWSFRVGETTVDLHVPGRHNVYNALAAFAAGMVLEIPEGDIAAALGSFAAPDKRMQAVTRDGVTWLDDSYNANPMSMRAAADVLANFPVGREGRKIAVLGDMLELGVIADVEHRAVGGKFAQAGAKYLIVAGAFAGQYREGAIAAGMPRTMIRECGDAEEAAAILSRIVRPGDVVLVKGSRAMKMEQVLAGKDTV